LHCFAAIMTLLGLRLLDLGSPLSLLLLWIALGTVFFALVRKLRRGDEFGTGRGL
jgi:hypothetical protein